MTTRGTLLVGSMPFASEADAMRRALTALGGSLLALPDGEIGEITPEFPNGKRSAWVMTAINICAADTENWQVVKQAVNDVSGFPSDYPNVQRLKAKRSPGEMHKYLKFGYDDYFKQSYPIFKQLREEFKLPNLKFQVGVPTGLGIAFSMMSPIDALRYADAFNKRVAHEVNEILKIASDDVVIQVEVPGEVAMSYQMPGFLVGLPVRSVLGLVRKIEPKAPFGIHLCLGDLNNLALVHAKTLDKLVHFSNSLVAAWPASHRLHYVHFPLAEAKDPPTLDNAFYQPLAQAKLPTGTHFVAGFVHEKLTAQQHQQLLAIIEQVRGGAVDIACSCGMGRRPRPIAEQLIQSMRETTGQGWGGVDSDAVSEAAAQDQAVAH
ncbi:MAG: hypothetical protein R3E39_22795 [Anaerolineae bacterium]